MISITSLRQIKALGDPQRLAILRQLMTGPATLSQLGAVLNASPAHIRHHLLVLQEAQLVELAGTRPVRGFMEKYYRATAGAYLVTLAVYPGDEPLSNTPVIASNDPAMESAVKVSRWPAHRPPLMISQNSLDGLVHLREGLVTMATCHLIDADTGIYNAGFVRHLFPGQAMVLAHLFQRTEGLILAHGNPKSIRSLDDLARPDVKMINREPGSGTRLWLDVQLKRLKIWSDIEGGIGYAHYATSHYQVAATIAAGAADAGLGQASAAYAYGLDFHPLFEEPYDLIMTQTTWGDPTMRPWLDAFFASPFCQQISTLAGYSAPANAGQFEIIL